MATADPFQLEDQTDEDFFDKLVNDDEFGLAEPGKKVEEVNSAPVESQEITSLIESKSSSIPLDELGETSKNLMEIGSPGSKSAGSKGTSVKEVQWASFGSGQGLLDMAGSDFFPEAVDQSASSQTQISYMNLLSDQAQSHQIEEISTPVTHEEQAFVGNEMESWENAYPGWRYDADSGQWYQIESYDPYSSSQIGDFSENFEEISSGNIATAAPAAATPTSDEKSEYPSNMIFDPQYPGWYYDTNTSQWYSLETYTQSSATISQESVASAVRQPVQTSELYNLESVQNQAQTVSFPSSQAQEDWGESKLEFPSNFEVRGRESLPADGSFSKFMPSDLGYGDSYQPITTHQSQNFFSNQSPTSYSQFSQSDLMSNSQYHLAPNAGRSLDGRPPHALVTFGFGGKLIIMKGYGNQSSGRGEVNILNLSEVAMENIDPSGIGSQGGHYFQALCKQPFPGPLVGGSASTRDLNKWIDESIASCDSLTVDGRKAELLKLLLSLLKICCQYYGKLRSPFGTDHSLQEADGPEIAVTRLFSSSKKSSRQTSEYGDLIHCMRGMPSEAQIRATALEVQNLLVSGRRKDALQCAQEGQLWGPALVLAAQLGDKFYVETVKQMAHRQFVSGSPLRTLCLLIAGQPADVFSTDHSMSNLAGVWNVPQQPAQVSPSGMLDDWEENLAIITANRTKDDELVIINLGDCLWKETGEVTAAHMCYLVAEANFESYSDKARLCLVGADHWRCPRTYASPEAIQRTELFEYSKVSGNSQFVLLPFQPYKLVYAHMLAEVGKVSDSLKYCLAIMKSLKSSGRDPEVEAWKGMVSSLEERLRAHQQGGYGSNLAPGKLVGKLFSSLDKSLHRMIGAPPASLPPLPPSHASTQEHEYLSNMTTKVTNMGMSQPLVSSASVETISGWSADANRKTFQSRSVSEPDFGRTPKQEPVNSGTKSSTPPTKSHQEGSRFGLFGSQLLQKTVGWMSRGRQAKLGESNKFYYDEKLKRWVEEGVETAAEPAPLPPPPTVTAFQAPLVPQYGSVNGPSTETQNLNGIVEPKGPAPMDYSTGVPPAPPSMNQFSARSRMGVRSRYVDTFNKGGSAPATSFQTPSFQPAKPAGSAKFFIPTAVAAAEQAEGGTDAAGDPPNEIPVQGDPAASAPSSSSSSSSTSPMPSSSMQRFPSMDNISARKPQSRDAVGSLGSRTRASSWSGAYPDAFNQRPPLSSSSPSLSTSAKPSFFSPNNGPFPANLGTGRPHPDNRGFGDDLQEVEL